MADNLFAKYGIASPESQQAPASAPTPTLDSEGAGTGGADYLTNKYKGVGAPVTVDSQVGQLKQVQAQTEARVNAPGQSSDMALPHSPLGPIERAAVGRLNPQQQRQALEEHFGKPNVSVVMRDYSQDGKLKMDYVVKDPQDGLWKQVDPAGLGSATVDLAKGNWSEAKQTLSQMGWKDVMGGAAQELGKDGGKMIAAGLAAAAAPESFGGSLAVLSAGYAAAGEGAIEQGASAAADAFSKTDLNKRFNALNPNLNVGPQNMEDFSHQLAADFVLGASGELLPRVASGIIKGGAAGFGKALELMTDTPQGRDAGASILQLMGHDASTARIRMNNPNAVAAFDKIAASDRVNETDVLGSRMKGAVSDFYNKAQAAKRTKFAAYDAIGEQADNATFQPSKDIMDSFEMLRSEGYMDNTGSPISGGGLERMVRKGTNLDALTEAINIRNQLKAARMNDDTVSYGQLKTAYNNLDTFVNGTDQVSDINLKRLLTTTKVAIKDEMSRGLHEYDPALAQQLGALDKQYGPVKEMLGQLGDKATPERTDAFIKQIIRNDGSHNAELMNSITNLLGTDNPTETILQMHTAQKSASSNAFKWNLAGGQILPNSPKLAAKAAGPISGAQKGTSAIGEFLADQSTSRGGLEAIPYAKKAAEMFRGLSPEIQQQISKNPEALKVIQQMIMAGPVAEQQGTNALVQQANQMSTPQPPALDPSMGGRGGKGQ